MGAAAGGPSELAWSRGGYHRYARRRDRGSWWRVGAATIPECAAVERSRVGRPRKTIDDGIGEKRKNPEFANPPASRQHLDIWEFSKADAESTYFGKLKLWRARLKESSCTSVRYILL